MSKAVNVILNNITFAIPTQILRATFRDYYSGWGVDAPSINDALLSRVLRPKVFADMSLVGGIEHSIDITGMPYSTPEVGMFIYRIPPAMRMNRDIISVEGLSFLPIMGAGPHGLSTTTDCSATSSLSMSNALMNAAESLPSIETARLEVLAGDTIGIFNAMRSPGWSKLKLILGYDPDLSGLSPTILPTLSRFAILGVKAFIFKTLKIPGSSQAVIAGVPLADMQGVIDSYENALDEYNNMLEVDIPPLLYSSDKIAMNRRIRSMLGGAR